MLIKKKLTKYIWVDDEKWKLEKVISPTKHDDYLLLSKKSDNTIHEDDTIPIYMILIDAHNDTFYPDNAIVRKHMKESKSWSKRGPKSIENEWLKMFSDSWAAV